MSYIGRRKAASLFQEAGLPATPEEIELLVERKFLPGMEVLGPVRVYEPHIRAIISKQVAPYQMLNTPLLPLLPVCPLCHLLYPKIASQHRCRRKKVKE